MPMSRLSPKLLTVMFNAWPASSIEAAYIDSSSAPLVYCASRGPGTLEITRLALSTLWPKPPLAASTCGTIDSSV